MIDLEGLLSDEPLPPPASTSPGVGDTSSVANGSKDAMARRLDAVASIMGGWVWETDAEHRFIFMTRSVQLYAGRTPEWHYGKTRQELGNQSVMTAGGRNWLEQLEERVSFGPVDFVRYQYGQALWMRTTGQPQFDENGEFTGYIGIAFELPEAPEGEGLERRTEARRKMVRAAEIVIADGLQPIACVLADISTHGARLHVSDTLALPKAFSIVVPALKLDRQCVVRWRQGTALGVEFRA
jgi:hypothetical protein